MSEINLDPESAGVLKAEFLLAIAPFYTEQSFQSFTELLDYYPPKWWFKIATILAAAAMQKHFVGNIVVALLVYGRETLHDLTHEQKTGLAFDREIEKRFNQIYRHLNIVPV